MLLLLLLTRSLFVVMFSTKKWWRFDDADVTPIAESQVGKEKEPKKARKKAAAQLGEGYVSIL